ncbi:hypothetical protein MTBSS4_680003 [Magnetospirillum sp. SS-4]|nr:hypothetical protein MTBSS4_680003 [Magnetospirillum sp. SS-4]
MWTTSTHSRMAAIEKKTKRYPSDLTDEEWGTLEPLLPQPSGRGRKRTTDLREVVNALRYMVRSGCEWRMLPVHFPPWQTVYWWFRCFVRSFLLPLLQGFAGAGGGHGPARNQRQDRYPVRLPGDQGRPQGGGATLHHRPQRPCRYSRPAARRSPPCPPRRPSVCPWHGRRSCPRHRPDP